MSDTLNISLRRISIGLTVLGIVVAGYLTFLHLTDSSALCNGFGGCDAVRQSRYSEVAGIPVALIGLFGYLAILAVLLTEELDGPLAAQALILTFGLTLVGTLYSLYLTYLELFVIAAICPYCIASAVIMIVIFGFALYRVLRMPPVE